ncbi:unnamed protein product [Merluccius merluccius]
MHLVAEQSGGAASPASRPPTMDVIEKRVKRTFVCRGDDELRAATSGRGHDESITFRSGQATSSSEAPSLA